MGKGKTDRSSRNQQRGIGKALTRELPQPLMKGAAARRSLWYSIHSNVVSKQWKRANFKCKSTSDSTPITWLELIDESIENKGSSPENLFIRRPWFGTCNVRLQDVHGERTMSVSLSLIRHGILYCWTDNYNRKEWKLDSDEVDPNCQNPSKAKHSMRVTNGVGFQGKIYVITMQGTLGVVEMVDSNIVTSFSKKRMVPSLECKSFREYMIVSDGRVLVVFLVSCRSVNAIDDVEVYQLMCKDLTWIRVENLRESSLFVDRNCACSMLAKEVGCCANHVIFSDRGEWWEYDMSTRSISPSKYILIENMETV